MSIQQIIALIIILFFLARVVRQKQSERINTNEFWFWVAFWLFSGLAIMFLPALDELVSGLGFSSSGIEFLLYLAVAVLFYFIFRLRLRLEHMERNITKIVKETALKEKK